MLTRLVAGVLPAFFALSVILLCTDSWALASPWIERPTQPPRRNPLPLTDPQALPASLATGADVAKTESIVEQSKNITIRMGKDTTIHCRTGSNITSCVWLWEFAQRDRTPTVVANFPGHGVGSADCSINLVKVSMIQTGWWTCRAQTGNSTILHSEPIFLQVYEGPKIKFEIKPTNRTFSLGGPAELECKTTIAVKTCVWSFQQTGQTEPLVVTEKPPKNERDCSLTLDNVGYEQAGTWRCGARTDDDDAYTYTDTANIQVEHKEEAFPVEFTEEPANTELLIGSSGRLHCKVREEAHIEDCRWYWTPVGRNPAWTVLMREFLPVNNDCSVEFANVTADPEGLWSCHVKPIHSTKFKSSKSAKLTVRGETDVAILTREVVVSEGEPLILTCVAEEAVKTCRWKKRPLFGADLSPWKVMETFPSSGNNSRDCSLRLDHVRVDHQGLWLCGVRFQDDQPFKDAMPAALTVKPPKMVRFTEVPRTQLAAENKSVTLNCSTLSAVHECLWMWYEEESKVTERVMKFNFKTRPDNDRDCSTIIPLVEHDMQGIWQCGVKYGNVSKPGISYGRPFSLTVVKTGPIMFREVSDHAHVVGGGRGLLECVTREPVEECRWTYRQNEASPVQEKARFQPENFNNCSMTVEDSAPEGLWTCGARNPGETNFTSATPSVLSFVSPGNVTTRSLISPDNLLVLVCETSSPVQGLECDWMHPSTYNVREFMETGKYTLEHHPDTGVCSLSFVPILVDIGHWRCIFSVNHHVLGEASFTVLSSPHNVRLSWIVGVLATVCLMLTVLLFLVITCRFYHCGRNKKASVKLNKPLPETSKGNNSRYSEDPTTGINFSFTENPELLMDFSIPSPHQESHHYERVGRFMAQRPNLYQNVD